jgi:hypothetical protein
MKDTQLDREFSSLLENLKQEVADFIAFLKNKVQLREKKRGH